MQYLQTPSGGRESKVAREREREKCTPAGQDLVSRIFVVEFITQKQPGVLPAYYLKSCRRGQTGSVAGWRLNVNFNGDQMQVCTSVDVTAIIHTKGKKLVVFLA